MGDLCQSVADSFKGDASAQQTLAGAQEKPDSKARQAALQAAIAEKMEDDADFAKEIQRLVETIKKEGVGSAFDQQGQTVQTQTNIAGGVQGTVFSGQFKGPLSIGGDANDFRGSKGAVIRPSGSVSQHFGDRNYYINIPKPDEIPRLPFIPEPPPDFTGRNEELKELLAEYAAGKNIIGLRGIGGVGKTALALKLALSLKDRYPDGQIMVDMMGSTNPISPMEAMAYVIHSYHRNEKIPESEAEVRDRYLEVLNGKRVLILLDNALDDKQVIKLIPPTSCALLVTSRMTIKIPGLIKKDLDVMKPDEAVSLLLNVYCPGEQDKLPGEDPAWPEIASLCGFLPLALRAAASYLANSDDISPEKYAQELKDERTRLETIGEQGVEMSVDASFGLSFQRLAAAVQKTFLDLSVFPADFDAQAEEKICLDDGHKNLSELVRWSLVDYRSHDRDYGRYRVHDLARLFASARQPDESRAIIAQRHSSYYKDLLAAADDLYMQGGAGIQKGLALFEREEANINAGHTWSCKSLEASSQAANLCMGYPDAEFM